MNMDFETKVIEWSAQTAAIMPFVITFLVCIFAFGAAYKFQQGDEKKSLGIVVIGSLFLSPTFLLKGLNWWPVIAVIGVAAAIFSGFLGFEFLRAKRLADREFRRIANEDIDACETEALVNETESELHDDGFWQIEIARVELRKNLIKKQKLHVRKLLIRLCESLALESQLSQHFVDHDEDALKLALAQERAALNNLIARFEHHKQEKEASKILQHLRNIASAVETLRTPKHARLLDRAEAWLDAFESTKKPRLTLSTEVKQ